MLARMHTVKIGARILAINPFLYVAFFTCYLVILQQDARFIFIRNVAPILLAIYRFQDSVSY